MKSDKSLIEVEHFILNERYITRSQIPNHSNLSFYDTQRFVIKYKQEIKNHVIGKIIYYRFEDVLKIISRL